MSESRAPAAWALPVMVEGGAGIPGLREAWFRHIKGVCVCMQGRPLDFGRPCREPPNPQLLSAPDGSSRETGQGSTPNLTVYSEVRSGISSVRCAFMCTCGLVLAGGQGRSGLWALWERASALGLWAFCKLPRASLLCPLCWVF